MTLAASRFLEWRARQLPAKPPIPDIKRHKHPSVPRVLCPFAVEPGIPIPTKARAAKLRSRLSWPFAKMVVGDSFLVTDPELFVRATRACNSWRANHSGWGFAFRTVADGIRIWRIA